jgi:hypothetical protein
LSKLDFDFDQEICFNHKPNKKVPPATTSYRKRKSSPAAISTEKSIEPKTTYTKPVVFGVDETGTKSIFRKELGQDVKVDPLSILTKNEVIKLFKNDCQEEIDPSVFDKIKENKIKRQKGVE